MILTTFWRRGGTWQRLNCSSRLHSRALKMGSELESRCSRWFRDSSSTHRHSAAQQRSLSIRTLWLLCSPPPGFLGFIFFYYSFAGFSARFLASPCSRAFGGIRGGLMTGDLWLVLEGPSLVSTSASGLPSHPVNDDK